MFMLFSVHSRCDDLVNYALSAPSVYSTELLRDDTSSSLTIHIWSLKIRDRLSPQIFGRPGQLYGSRADNMRHMGGVVIPTH
jgi:hypothetical protein